MKLPPGGLTPRPGLRGAKSARGFKSITGRSAICLKQCASDWLGNVREMAHVIERLVVTVEGGEIGLEDLPPFLIAEDCERKSGSEAPVELEAALEACEARLVLDAYRKGKSSRKVAVSLGISQSRASRLLRKHLPRSGEL